jgi:ABC-type sugar transport system ATPase subunit
MKIKVENLCKYYDKTKAVDGLGLSVNSGELVAILGPSGCGKSTFLYMLAGIVEPSAGDIYFGDQRINNVPIEKRNIGLVFQNYSLYPHMTVLENLMFPLKMLGLKKKEALEEARNISRVLRIEELLERKPGALSGGQQQRVAIGRALIKKPRLLLMDEPFSNLDAALRLEMREEVKELQRNFGITTLFVTHDQEEALSIADKILLMNLGQAVQYSNGEELYNKPVSRFAAEFIGNPRINMFESHQVKALHPELEENIIGVRPEDVLLFKAEDCSIEETIEASILEVQSLGKETHFKVEANGIVVRGLIMGSLDFGKGDRVRVKFKRMHYFKS